MRNQFIQNMINSSDGICLSQSFLKFWYLYDIDDGHDAMGCLLMGGEI